MEIVSHHCFRVTRAADLARYNDEEEEPQAGVQARFKRNRRRDRAVRLDVGDDMSPEVLILLLRELELGPQDVHAATAMLDPTSLIAFQAAGASRPSETA
jgi:polyphosphate kinase